MAESTGSRRTIDDDFWVTKPTDCQTSDNNLGGVSVWCDGDDIFRFLDNVCEGDRLELDNDKLPYLHSWAICKSISKWNPFPWYAVQFFNDDEWGTYSTRNTFLNVAFPPSKDVTAIVVTPIFTFLFKTGGKVRINNFTDTCKDWSPPLGERRIRKEITYQLKELHEIHASLEVYVCRNRFIDSEDFVNYCRYGYCKDNNYRRVSEWYSKDNIDIEGFFQEFRVGDRLEFRYSSPYQRWGIYIGQWGNDLKQVVLFDPGDSAMTSSGIGSSARPKPELWVKSIWIHVVIEGRQVRINNKGDLRWSTLDGENILEEISSQLPGKTRRHACKVLFKDSEDFVNYCRYDDWRINFGLVCEWCPPDPSPRLHVGDRLEFSRTLPYAHWGIYVGDWEGKHHQVVHFAPAADGNAKLFSKNKSFSLESSAKDKPELCVDDIWEVSGNDKVKINNDRDHFWPPLVRTDILDKMKHQLDSQSDGNKPVYRLFSNNCEHFVNYCRYGKHHSDQVNRISWMFDQFVAYLTK
ncbi:uncharacterized protein LOC119725734 [Patiria miniata]|uniref:LRAT domain-containing protein n=1 Tax=Patiria miniata TaxID=46514 RepID=A0A913ZQ71_PATMI|nr:uncharacterized protein LOC119725734 [Patiria miniata]